MKSPPAPGLARHAPCPCPCGGALGCWLADMSCCSLRSAQGRARVSGGVSAPYSCRAWPLPPTKEPGGGALGSQDVPASLAERTQFSQKGEMCVSFPISRLSFLWVFCTRRLCWSCWGDALPDWERVLGCFPNSYDWVSRSGMSPEGDLETTTPEGTVWMLNVRGIAHLSSGFHHFCGNWGFPVWWTLMDWYFTCSPFLGIWGEWSIVLIFREFSKRWLKKLSSNARPCLFILFIGISRQECWIGLPFLLQWNVFCQNSPLWPVCLEWPCMPWLIASLSYISHFTTMQVLWTHERER